MSKNWLLGGCYFRELIVWIVGYGATINAFCSAYFFRNIQKDAIDVQGAWHSPNTFLTMLHGRGFITRQSSSSGHPYLTPLTLKVTKNINKITTFLIYGYFPLLCTCNPYPFQQHPPPPLVFPLLRLFPWIKV